MPMGVPTTTARPVRIRLPKIGLSSPPAAPGGGVISVKTRSDNPLKPSQNSTPRISTSQPSPMKVAATDSDSAIALRRRRAAYSAVMSRRGLSLDPQQQIADATQNDQGDDEQDHAERDQRRGVNVAD